MLALTAIFMASRLAYWAAGIRFDASALDGPPRADPWQLLDRRLLRHQLATSVWHLHSQPPLFNVASGLLVKMPGGLATPVATVSFLALGLVVVLCSYGALVELRVPTPVAGLVAVLLIADPSYVLYENWYSYVYPTAALLTVAALAYLRYLRTHRWSWGAAGFGAMSLVILLNSTYQAVWILAVLAATVAIDGRRWRTHLSAAAVPVLLVGGWYLKDAVQFGTYTTSSWLGMNLTRTTLAAAPPEQIAHLVRDGVLTPLSRIGAFSPVAAYGPGDGRRGGSGVSALDEPVKSDGTTNFNDRVYVPVSRRYLHDDLAYIEARPGAYLATVAKGAALWVVPGDEYAFVKGNELHLAHWVRLYDGVVLWQLGNDRQAPLFAIFRHRGPTLPELPLAVVGQYLAVLVGAPILAWRRRRDDRPLAGGLVFMWVTTGYALAVTSLVEFGENERFRFELGPLPLLCATAVVVAAVRAIGPGGLPAAGVPAAGVPAAGVSAAGV